MANQFISLSITFRLSNRSLVDDGVSLLNTSYSSTKNHNGNGGKGVKGLALADLVHNSTLREEFSVRCVIAIENWTAWRLKDPLSHNHCGYVYEGYPARPVEPATREVMVGRKQVWNDVQFLLYSRLYYSVFYIFYVYSVE